MGINEVPRRKPVDLWKRYKLFVWNLTKKQPIHTLKDYDKRGFDNVGCYHLDHRVSIWYGYKNNIDPMVIASMHNLEYILGDDNLKKCTRCVFLPNVGLQTMLFIDYILRDRRDFK